MATNGDMDEKFHVEMQKEDGFFDGIFDNIEDIDIFDFSGFDTKALPHPPLTSSSHDVGSRLTAEENRLCDDLNIPEDWLNNLLDDTNFNLNLPTISTTIVPKNDYITEDDTLFWSTSPVSVLEDGGGVGSGSRSSSSSSDYITNASPSIPARARTKRPRPAGLLPRVSVSAGILPVKKKKKKCPPFVASDDTSDYGVGGVRKCMHCGIQKTPQWRAGPTGPKSLCNACGVRYKSGRLFPEYRPAASPTFVPSVHSNSHKKVVEMRIKACQMDDDAMPKAASPASKNCDLVAYIRG